VKTCSVEGCNNYVWSKGVCKNHIPKEPIRTNKIKTVRTEANPMHLFFKEIWKERKHYSEVSGDYLGSEALSTFFHHILPKSKYPELQYDKSNIILLTLPEHESVENDIYRFEEVNRRRIELLNKINQ
jgi:hypothetical protein